MFFILKLVSTEVFKAENKAASYFRRTFAITEGDDLVYLFMSTTVCLTKELLLREAHPKIILMLSVLLKYSSVFTETAQRTASCNMFRSTPRYFTVLLYVFNK